MCARKQSKNDYQVLHERAKELECLYEVENLLSDEQRPLAEILQDLTEAIPSGWRYTDVCQVKIEYEDEIYTSAHYVESTWSDTAPIVIEKRSVGFVEVSYRREVPASSEGPFLKEESKLIRTIADRIGQTIYRRILGNMLLAHGAAADDTQTAESNREWIVVVDLLRRTDEGLYLYIARKMLHYLFWRGIKESRKLLNMFGANFASEHAEGITEVNTPSQKQSRESIFAATDEVFAIAARQLKDREILTVLHKWIQEHKLSFLIRAVDTTNVPLGTVIEAIMRYRALPPEEAVLPPSTAEWLNVSLIRRFFSEDSGFIQMAKKHLEASDFFDLTTRIIYPAGSTGCLGGKSTGLILAHHILSKAAAKEDIFNGIKTPTTWYMTTDCMQEFLRYNDLEDVKQQKYKDLEQVRVEYPNIIQLFKHASFPDEIAKGLSLALDDIGKKPIIVRSSSLLEDRVGTAFSGKYKSLFLSNQGSKRERLDALFDAIAEVYASVFGPDPISYRSQRGLVDFREEMGIMIQEVVGTRIGPYLMPTYAGVAFSSNEFRWSPRLKRDDGLIRLVPGLGTRAVDRISNDYPMLISPGQPALRVNVSPDEVRHYSPSYVDVINLDARRFETVPLQKLLHKYGAEISNLHHLVSVYTEGNIRQASAIALDVERDELICSFEGLIARTNFINQVRSILSVLQEGMETPVDIEFASDTRSFYLLQCRPQYTGGEEATSAIPQDVPDERKLFTANRFISNGHVPDITHIVYVSPIRYSEISSRETLLDIGRAVGRLNVLLPKHQFILMGPGRWGSRGDIKQGVQVSYSDICNTAVLIEIARKRGCYSPELSFGTHFFQDMVEAGIRYIPLYPDDESVVFNEIFLNSASNLLSKMLPEFSHVSDAVHVIDVPASKDGNILKILMNAEIGQAIGYFTESSTVSEPSAAPPTVVKTHSEDFWRWRYRMAERLVLRLQPDRFGVKAVYLIGSTLHATAGPGSDIDLLVHFHGTEDQRQALLLWLEGWSMSLAEQNLLRTGYEAEGLLDVHFVTDADIEARTSFAVKINAITDPALALPMKSG